MPAPSSFAISAVRLIVVTVQAAADDSDRLSLRFVFLLSRSSLSVRPVRHCRRPLRLRHPPRQPPPPASFPPPAAPLCLIAYNRDKHQSTPRPLISIPKAILPILGKQKFLISTPSMETSKESVLQRSSRASIPSSPARAASGSLIPKGNLQKPSFLEFVTFERVKVVSMLGLALALCNADRVVMSVAIVPLSQAYGWSRSFAGIVQLSFLWGYLMSPIIGGVLVDYYGGKIVMACDVTLWSMATFLTP